MNRYCYALMIGFLLSSFSIEAQTYSISGQIKTAQEDGVCDVIVTLTEPGGNAQTVNTDGSGNYIFTNVASDAQGMYTIIAEKNTYPLNGISAFDLVLHQRHILGISLLEPYQLLALDVNASGTNTILDILLTRRLILAIDSSFPIQSWRIFASGNDWPIPGSSTPPAINHTFVGLNENKTDLDFFALKIGDMNGSAITNCN